MKTLFVCALYIEAKPLIHELQLKDAITPHANFPVFANDEYALIISGTGKIASASATAFLCSLYPDAQIILNFGVCGAGKNEKVGDIFLIDQIIDHDSGKTFYPDILEKPRSNRAGLRTLSKPESTQSFTEVVDMEASGFFESASHFFTADKIQVFKIVSDHQNTTKLSLRDVESLIQKHIGELRIQNSKVQKNEGQEWSEGDKNSFVQLLSSAHFSLTQERELKKLLWSLHIQKDIPISTVIAQIPLEKEQNLKNIAKKILAFLHKIL